MEVKRYENDELHIVLKNPYCNNSHKSQHNTVTVDMNGSRLVWNVSKPGTSVTFHQISYRKSRHEIDMSDSRNSSFRKATYTGTLTNSD